MSDGGSGGSLWIKCDTLTHEGIISATGGHPTYGENGGDGRIRIDCRVENISGQITPQIGYKGEV